MMKYASLFLFFILLSCGNQEDILLPKSNLTLVSDVKDHSPTYIFFRTNGKDTLAEVNRKNAIISTNWIFNIDKRLPLRLVIPEVMKLQEKKRAEVAHKNEAAQNYYSYADTIGKNMAFLPFTKVFYKMEQPLRVFSFIYFQKNGSVKMNDDVYAINELPDYLNNLFIEHESEIIFGFDKNLSFGEYIRYKIFIKKMVVKKKGIWINHDKEFVY